MSLKPRGGLSTLANYAPTIGLDGYSDAAMTWFPAGNDIVTDGTRWGGVVVDIPLVTATGRPDLVLNPPTFTDLELTLKVSTPYLPAGNLHTYTLYLVDLVDPPDFATGGTSPTAYVNAGTVILMDVQNLVSPIPLGYEFTSTIDLNEVFPIYRQATWAGRFAFVFRFERDGFPATLRQVGSAAHLFVPGVLASVELPFIGGRSGNVEARSRVDRCPICGFYDVREKFIPDGYRAGLLVCEKCWDPEDPPSSPIPPDVPPIND
jgi:hypothetical protein